MVGLEEKGYAGEPLQAITELIQAEQSDLYDVLAYIAFCCPTQTREERVETRRAAIFSHYSDSRQEFLNFVLSQYVAEGVGELAQDKLPDLLELKYHTLSDAREELGGILEIRDVFIGFQGYLYGEEA